jgi:hypothetical protein
MVQKKVNALLTNCRRDLKRKLRVIAKCTASVILML